VWEICVKRVVDLFIRSRAAPARESEQIVPCSIQKPGCYGLQVVSLRLIFKYLVWITPNRYLLLVCLPHLVQLICCPNSCLLDRSELQESCPVLTQLPALSQYKPFSLKNCQAHSMLWKKFWKSFFCCFLSQLSSTLHSDDRVNDISSWK